MKGVSEEYGNFKKLYIFIFITFDIISTSSEQVTSLIDGKSLAANTTCIHIESRKICYASCKNSISKAVSISKIAKME